MELELRNNPVRKQFQEDLDSLLDGQKQVNDLINKCFEDKAFKTILAKNGTRKKNYSSVVSKTIENNSSNSAAVDVYPHFRHKKESTPAMERART